ncbi:MAG: DNA/RNA non-specific endonuclease [Ignavibacteriales bacterium]|nr:DNA/RNA non-specific endonuclease [Ignavibacteriales bacterium]
MKKIFSFLLLFSFSFAQNDSAYRAEHLLFGNPSKAINKTSKPTNYLMVKKQYVLSYHRFNGIPNWVAWHLDSTWLGEIKRSNDFRADSTLPEKWYWVHDKSYRRSGYDRGHMCPSGDRTNTQYDNSMTFLMTNMIPQAPNNNQGPWADLEIYCRELVKQGKELYIYCGGYGSQGFLDSGRVNIPERTWKVILILNAGDGDVQRVTTATRTIAVDMPNNNSSISKNDDWKAFRVSIDFIESKSGFNFFSKIPDSIEKVIEQRIDTD